MLSPLLLQYWSQGTVASTDAKISGFIKSQEASSNFVTVINSYSKRTWIINSINSIKTPSSGELIAEQAFSKFPRTAAMPYPGSCLRKLKSQQIHEESVHIICHDFPGNPHFLS